MLSGFRVWLFIILTMMLLLSLVYSVYLGMSPLIGWPELALGVLLIFVGIGDRISKLVVSSSEISIEQSLEAQVKQFATDSTKIEQYVTQQNTDINIAQIIEDSLEHPRDLWSRLLIIRVTLRRLLRMVCNKAEIRCSDLASITNLLDQLQNAGLIDHYLTQQIETIRRSTVSVEWGAGPVASANDIKFTLENYGAVFTALKQRAKELSSRNVSV